MTAQEIFNMAVEESNLNDAALINETVWLDFLTSWERAIYLAAARENPDYFGREGTTDARGSSTATWSLTSAPGNIASVQKVEVSAITGTVTGVSVGDDVNVVSVLDPDTALAPRVYVRNKVMREYNEELQDDSSNYVTRLKVFYSYLPTDKTATTDSMDLPDEHNMLLVLPLASLMALRDQRPDEAVVIDQRLAIQQVAFLRQITVFDSAAVRPFDRFGAPVPELRVS